MTNPSFGFLRQSEVGSFRSSSSARLLACCTCFAGDRREEGREGRGGGGWIRCCCCCWSGAESKSRSGNGRSLARSLAPREACSKKLVRNPKGAFSEACFYFYKRKDFPGVKGERIREKTVSLWVGLSSSSEQQASVSLQPVRERERTLIPPLTAQPHAE